MNMQIGFIGAGKAGCALGSYFTSHGFSVSGYFSRSFDSAREASSFTSTAAFETAEELIENSSVIFITTPDSAIAEVWSQISAEPMQAKLSGKIICHTSGAMSSDVFAGAKEKGCFVFSVHPLLAFPKRLSVPEDLPRALFTAEGSDEGRDVIDSLITGCGNTLQWIRSEDKIRYHAAAVFASNLAVGLYDIAFDILESAGFSGDNAREAFEPLIRGNINSVLEKGTTASLTGPVERNDVSTVKKHIKALSEEERNVYNALSLRVLEIAQKKHGNSDFSALKAVLKE